MATALMLVVDGEELRPEAGQKIINHSPDGFNAGYGGSGPAQSALAILLKVLSRERAIRLHNRFKDEFLTNPDYQENDFEFEVDIKAWANMKELGY